MNINENVYNRKTRRQKKSSQQKKEKAHQREQKKEFRRQRELEKTKLSKQRELKRLEKEIGNQRELRKKKNLRRRQMRKKEELKFRQMREKEELKSQQMRKREELKLQRMREKEELVRKMEDQARLRKETQKWEREIGKEEKRQVKILDDLKWRGKKKFRDIRKKLQNKLKKIEKSGKNIRPILISEAIRRNTSKWIINGDGFKDPEVFLESTTPAVERLINSIDSVGKKVNAILVCKMVRTNPETGRDVFTIAHFRSKTHNIISEEDIKNEYLIMKEKMLENLAKYQKLSSGWRLHSIETLEIFITKFKPLKGKSYKPFPNVITKKKAVINMETMTINVLNGK